MKITNPLQFIYGLFMGTTVEFLKAKRPSFPVSFQKISEELYIKIGGVQNCGIVVFEDKVYFINGETNDLVLLDFVSKKFPNKKVSSSEKEVQRTVVDGIFKTSVTVWQYKDYLFLGNLFLNQIHPDLHNHEVKNLKKWIEYLKSISPTSKIIPGEGNLAESNDLAIFIKYLEDLSNSNIDYQTLKSRYGHFQELVGVSSLSENMDALRKI